MNTTTDGQCFRALCLLSAVVALSLGEAGAQIQSLAVKKSYTYVQNSATGASLDPASNNYSFGADVNGVNIGGITPPTITGPYNPALSQNNGGVLVYSTGDHGWRFGTNGDDYGTATLANLNAAFSSGIYTIHVNGVNVPLNLTGDAYPNVPIVTLTGGSWANGKYVFDPAQPVTITTNAYAGYGTHVDDAICMVVLTPGFTIPFASVAPYGCAWMQASKFASSSPGSNTLSYTVPANTFIAGQEYLALAAFGAVVDKHPDPGLPGSTNVAGYEIATRFTLKAQAPLFPLNVTSNITPTVSNATATFQPRPQDVGTTASVYVFAIAPSTAVMNAAAAKATGLTWKAKGADADTPVQCLLAQLNSSGQLQAVSASNLAAYITGALSAQGQSVSLLANVPTPNIAGATFYLGYGTSAQQMIASGVNQRALSVASTSVRCDPEAPEAGWWWNTAEGGRGYSIEVAGNHIFYASYLYDVSGRATWLVASGNTSVDGSLFTGNLEAYAQGQTLGGTYHAPTVPTNPGPITLAFSDARHGAMVWPGGSVPIERFNIVPNGLNLPAQNNQPESGWWWNPTESGRGFFLEWQGGELFMAGYMYDDAGNPIWYLATNTTPSNNLQSFSANWWQFGNGPTLTGAFKPAQQVNGNVAPVTITFQGSENAIMTLPGGRTTAIRRFRF